MTRYVRGVSVRCFSLLSLPFCLSLLVSSLLHHVRQRKNLGPFHSCQRHVPMDWLPSLPDQVQPNLEHFWRSLTFCYLCLSFFLLPIVASLFVLATSSLILIDLLTFISRTLSFAFLIVILAPHSSMHVPLQ